MPSASGELVLGAAVVLIGAAVWVGHKILSLPVFAKQNMRKMHKDIDQEVDNLFNSMEKFRNITENNYQKINDLLKYTKNHKMIQFANDMKITMDKLLDENITIRNLPQAKESFAAEWAKIKTRST